MAQFINKKQLLKATDEEIQQFFATTIFEGVFSSEIKSKNTDFYKGHIHSIKINGEPTNVIGSYINVPKFANDIPEGECTFKCRVKEEIRDSLSQINFTLNPRSLRSKFVSVSRHEIKDGELTKEDLFELWGVDDCEFIGYYHFDSKSEGYLVDDLRKTNFDRIPSYLSNNKPITLWLKYPQKGIELNNYYRFRWRLSHKDINNPYEIYLDNRYAPQIITPKWFINKLFEDRHSDKSKNFGSAANFLDTLSKQLSAKESTFVYELLQNANDYPVEGQKVDVEFHITNNYLLFLHSGDKFNVRNISGICGINEKEKVANKKTIGYKGIGFKTVFLNNHYVYIRTGDYSFRFDQGETPEKKRGGIIKRQDAPFQILPIWTEHEEVSPEINSIFDKADKRFQVQIALRPDSQRILHYGKNSYENLFRDVFSDSNIILFIPNINSVKVFINGNEERTCYRNNEEWIVGDYENEIKEELRLLINRTIEKGNSRIPEKYKDFDFTKVSFACRHQGAMVKPVDDATLYCYLPTKASWGLPFLMNTDMIPKGDRNDIETEVKLLDEDDTNFNEELAEIAGSKLFLWIRDLLISKKYHLGSVFSLAPDFKKCKKEHKEYVPFIERFEDAFNSCLETEQIVPVSGGIAIVKRVILDTTGLSTSGIMTDDEFRRFAGLTDYYLPLPMLRKDKNFNSFLKRYATNEQKFEVEHLTDFIANVDFQKWLKNQDNNNKFLNFLLENNYLEDLLSEKIFIEEECGDLYSAEELFYNIDEELKDLSVFSNHLYYLSLKTREFFEGNKKWNEVVDGQFAEYDGDDFIKNTLLSENWNETVRALTDWETSFHFYRYIANNNIVPDELTDLPFFNDEESPALVDNFNDKFVFLSSKDGENTCEAPWLSSISFAFITSKYDKSSLDYLEVNAGVRKFSHAIIARDIILSEDYENDINNLQQDDLDSSIDFVKYCYEHKELFDKGSLRNYALNAFDCEGNNDFVLYEDHIFFPSSCFDRYSEKKWINADWMFCLAPEYLSISADQTDVKDFLKKAFYVDELDDKIFYKEVVRNYIASIIDNTSAANDSDGKKNIDFISYLDENYKHIFEDKKDAEKFAAFIFISDSGSNIESDSSYIYSYNTELKEILDSDWFPTDTVYMCSRDYGNSKAIIAIKAREYNFSNFFDDVITKELANINSTIISKEASVAFHCFIIEHLRELTDPQKEVMKDAKVYLYGSDEPCDSSAGHKILSKSARELSSMGLVEFADLDIIDPDYHIETNEDYWKNRLGNEQFTVADFVNWLNENVDTFYRTIEDKENNINFWRWIKGCKLADKTLEALPVLPIYLSNDGFVDSNNTIYLSDNYILDGGIETIVKKYNENAVFVSADYIKESDDIEAWKMFWCKLGIRFEMIDILIDTIDNRLCETEDEKLPATVAKYRLKLDEHYDGKLIQKLSGLRVKANDGKFYNLSDVIYVDCEKNEPFTYIKLPNQAIFNTAEERKLITDIIEEIEGKKIDRLTEWQAAKINRYIEIQNDSELEELLRSIHFKFVDELAAMYNNDREILKQFDNITEVLFLDSNEEFCAAKDLTLGSIYAPFCDFERFGLDYQYLSESYKSECNNDIRKMLNRIFKIHCDFKKNDIEKLTNRDFSIYFWGQYLLKKDADISGIKEMLQDGAFDSFECIPTKDFMKSPNELYYGDNVSKYVKYIEDWENKVPLKNLPDIKLEDGFTIFSKLPFKDSLDFLDGLYALISVRGQYGRTQILEWMIDSYDESCDGKVSEYREDEHALWYNNKNELVHIKKLYALNDEKKTLEQYFGNNSRIVNKAYFPASDYFKKACDILGIKTISLHDLRMEPQGDTIFTQRNDDLKLFALVIAGMIDSDNWKDLYEKFLEKLNSLVLHQCKSIMISYAGDESINQSLRKFYHEEGSEDFYFVDSLDGKRVYTLFVEEFSKYLGIEKDDIPKEMIEDIMDSRQNAIELIREQNSLLLDEDFKDALNELVPGIKRELNGNETLDDDNEPMNYRPTFTTSDSQEPKNDDNDGDIDNEPDVDNCSNDSTLYGSNNETTEIDLLSTDNNIRETSARVPNSDKNGTYNCPDVYPKSERTDIAQTQKKSYPIGEKIEKSHHPYTNHDGWNDASRGYTPLPPKPFSPEDDRNFGSNGKQRTLEIMEPSKLEIDTINRLLDDNLSAEQIADQNYLVRYRLYQDLKRKRRIPEESESDFVRNAHLKNEHILKGGKYIHTCSAVGGIMYLSPSIWNMIDSGRCIVCVYLGAKTNEFMYFESTEDILNWVREDDIIIKLTGEEKADVVQKLYSGILKGVKGTAYTMIRIGSNEKYNSIFAPITQDPNANDSLTDDDI